MNPFFVKFRETKYIRLNPRQCEGCWDCVAVCPRQVLGVMKGGPKHHVHVVNAEACNGCKKCVRACEHGALEYIYVPQPVSAPDERPVLRQ
jgi:NAD-dependent dihydropyrimidine dehydrogenase PreA subunit